MLAILLKKKKNSNSLLEQIGDNFVVDPTLEEESCSAAGLVMSVTPNGRVTSVVKLGYSSLLPNTLIKMLQVITID
jgi:exosome complex component RRP42